MAHIHSVYDTEPHFQIDKTSREVKNVSASKTTITQFDHNSERFTFEIPRFIDGHDMSLCNVVQVHYINIDSTDKTNKIVGVYTVDDLQLSPEDENIVICSWLISQNATQLAGPLTFLLRYTCSNDGVLDYAWNTARCTSITVSNGLYNGEAIIEEYFDILAVWEQKIVADVTAGIDKTIEEKVDNVKIVETATGSAITIDSSEAPIPCLKLLGKTTQEGTPTPDNPIELKSVGDSGSYSVDLYRKNLLDVNNTTQTINGVTFTNNGDGSVTVKGTPTKDTTYLLNSNANIKLPKGKYKMIGKSWFIYLKLDGVTQATYRSNNGDAFEIGDGNYTIQTHLFVGANTTVDFTTYPMLLLADETDLTFEKGIAPQTLTLTDTLRGVDNIADEIDFARGVNVQKVGFAEVLSYISRIADLPNGNKGLVVTLPNKITKTKNALICSHAREDKNANTTFEDGTCYENEGNIVICGNSTDTLETLKAKYGEAVIQYELATPIETPISESELNAYRHLMTNKGTTTVLSECDVEMLYYVNKPTAQAVGDIHTQINKDYFKTLSLIAENVATVEETESESEE